MKIATWNVNSIKARLKNATDWIADAKPDVLCMQEIKCIAENFPSEAFEDLGYNVAVHGQKTYNGVALLSRFPIEDVTCGLPGDDDDEQARYLEAVIAGDGAPMRIASIYLPNGNPAPGPKYDYKLSWMDRLIGHTQDLLAYEETLILAGDFNVIPTDEDVHDPKAWANDALFLPATHEKFYTLLNLGLTDAFRARVSQPHRYTFWDYQRGAWQKDNGIRIDHLLLSPQAADRLGDCEIDSQVRGKDKPSDHVPIWCEILPD